MAHEALVGVSREERLEEAACEQTVSRAGVMRRRHAKAALGKWGRGVWRRAPSSFSGTRAENHLSVAGVIHSSWSSGNETCARSETARFRSVGR